MHVRYLISLESVKLHSIISIHLSKKNAQGSSHDINENYVYLPIGEYRHFLVS